MEGNHSECNSWFVPIGATNHPENIDPAMLRRFQQMVMLTLPSLSDREKMLRNMLQGCYNTLTDADANRFAKITDGFLFLFSIPFHINVIALIMQNSISMTEFPLFW
jgi:SpoVK/Ycf46/Vps4 family AAA+-type ATPase